MLAIRRAIDEGSSPPVNLGPVSVRPGTVVLFGGPAGAGKSTLARAWSATRPQAVHVQIDEIRALIVSGLADPQEPSDLNESQYRATVHATCAMAHAFTAHVIDVAIDDVLEPDAFDRFWQANLAGQPWRLVIVLPSLDETLARSRGRNKRVSEKLTRTQHARSSDWDDSLRLDTTGLDVAQSLALVLKRLG